MIMRITSTIHDIPMMFVAGIPAIHAAANIAEITRAPHV
jgi:hypothetical protein